MIYLVYIRDVLKPKTVDIFCLLLQAHLSPNSLPSCPISLLVGVSLYPLAWIWLMGDNGRNKGAGGKWGPGISFSLVAGKPLLMSTVPVRWALLSSFLVPVDMWIAGPRALHSPLLIFLIYDLSCSNLCNQSLHSICLNYHVGRCHLFPEGTLTKTARHILYPQGAIWVGKWS